MLRRGTCTHRGSCGDERGPKTAQREEIFPWLKKCEQLFGFENLKGYGLTRIYGFLAERFMSYWFKKNTNFKELPILFYDINDQL